MSYLEENSKHYTKRNYHSTDGVRKITIAYNIIKTRNDSSPDLEPFSLINPHPLDTTPHTQPLKPPLLLVFSFHIY